MAWIESHQGLINHRKTGRLARSLGISKVHVVGHLHAFWWWCLDNAPRGELTDCIPAEIADAAYWEGDAELFMQAMVLAGFLDVHGDSDLVVVHDWMDYAGKLVEQREANARRMKGARAKNMQRTSGERVADVHDTCNERAAHVQRTDGAHATNVHGACDERAPHVQGLPYPTVPNRTVPDQTIDTPFTPMGGNQALPTADVFAWAPARTEASNRGKPLPDVAITLEKVAEWRSSFPLIDVDVQVRNCVQWMRDNPLKVGPGAISRIGNWLRNSEPTRTATGINGEPMHPVDASIPPDELEALMKLKALAEARHVKR